MGMSELISGVVEEYLASDEGKLKVETAVKKTVNDVISDSLGRYSDFGKKVTESVGKALAIHDDIDLPSYNHALLKIIERQVEFAQTDAIERQVASRMKELLTPAPKSIKLSELLEQYREFLKDRHQSGCVCDGEARFKIEIKDSDTTGFWHVRLWEEADTVTSSYSSRRSQPDIDFGVYKGTMYTLSFGSGDVQKQMFVGPLHGFQRLLFQMNAAKSEIIRDCTEDDVETSYSMYESV